MYRFFFIYLFLFVSFSANAQDNFWEEAFGTDAGCGINDANGFTSLNGTWTVESVGPNGVTAHNWYIGPREAGMDVGDCGSSCLIDPDLEGNSLYIGIEALNATNGAVFQNDTDTETHLRAVSPVVSFAGVSSDMSIELEYIYSGHPTTVCVFEYYDGTTWNDLWEIEPTMATCGDDGEWSLQIIALPASINGNPSVQFGFRWENTGPDLMPIPELSFAVGKMGCNCTSILEAGIDEENLLDPNVQPNPVESFMQDEWDCAINISETYFLSPWAVDVFGQSTVELNCSMYCDQSCTLDPVVLEWVPPGCDTEPITFEISSNSTYQGPQCVFEAFFDFPSGTTVCAGQCLDFTFGWSTDNYFFEVTGGGTVQNVEYDGMSQVEGQVCFDAPGSYTITGTSSDPSFPCQWAEGSATIQVSPADFEPEIVLSQNDICPGSCVEFSTEDIPGAEFNWTFEGGIPAFSNEAQPGPVCFNDPGNYGVSLSISGGTGCGFAEVPEGLTVIDCGDAPTAAFSASTASICAGECIDFTDESVGSNIDSWEWNFEMANPVSSDDQNPTNVCYDTPGLYEVSLSVTNLAGSGETVSQDFIEVVDCADPPVASFAASATDLCVGDCISFIDQSSGSDNDTWTWTFEGAETTTSSDQNPENICYETPGAYSVTLSVTNPDGTDESTVNALIIVDPCWPEPEPAFEVSETVLCVGDCVDFENNSTTTTDEIWSWSFDGADTPASAEESPQGICYSEPGVYDVSLEVTDVGGTQTQVQQNLITVEECPEPNAFFSVSDTVICPGECVQLSNASSGIVTGYTWAFPDGIMGDTTAINPELCFDQAGTYSITLTAYNDDGETSTFTLEQAVAVDPCLPELSIAVSEDRICVGDCVSFNNVSEETTSDWQWTFSGAVNTTSQAENPAEVCYHTPGVFDVTLQAWFAGVPVDSTFSQIIHVIDSCGPVANFNFTPILCLGQCYDFENTSTGGNNYFWIFEGAENALSEEENPTDICYLDETGLFNVTLTVSNEFGSSTSLTQQVSVVNPPNLNAGPDQTITQGTKTVLSAMVGGGTGEFIWQPYEDVVCFSCQSTSTVTLHETTTFVVYYEESGGCQVSDTVTVFVEESLAFGVPESFSPNGDGINDILYVRGSNITSLDFMVYNRYGQQVFRTTNQLEGWDGTLNGRQLDAGVFGYSLEIRQNDMSRTVVKGDVDLVR